MEPSAEEVIEAKCTLGLERLRWPQGIICPECAGSRIARFTVCGKSGKPRLVYECADCKHQFTVTTGSFFHDSHLKLAQWFLAIARGTSGAPIPTATLARELSVSYSTAKRMQLRIRKASASDRALLIQIASKWPDISR